MIKDYYFLLKTYENNVFLTNIYAEFCDVSLDMVPSPRSQKLRAKYSPIL